MSSGHEVVDIGGHVTKFVYASPALTPDQMIVNPHTGAVFATTAEQPGAAVAVRKYIQEINAVPGGQQVTVKPERVMLACKLCEYKTFHKHALDRHIGAVHDKVKFYQCSRCDYKTGHSSALKRHESKVHEKNSQISYVCDSCDYQTVHKSALKRHVANRHQRETQVVHECSLCDYRTTYEFALQRHYSTVHLKEGVFECNLCEYNTVHKHALDRHVKMVHEKPAHLSCRNCNYKSAHKSALRLHYATVHECKDTYKCDKCGYETLYKTALNRHQSTVMCGQGEKVPGAATYDRNCQSTVTHVVMQTVGDQNFKEFKPVLNQLESEEGKHEIVYDTKEQTIVIQAPAEVKGGGAGGGLLSVGSLVPLTIQRQEAGPGLGLEYHNIGDVVHVVRGDVAS